MKKTYKDSCWIELKIGEKIQEIRSGKVGVLKDVYLTPNFRYEIGGGRKGLVAILIVQMTGDRLILATSDKFCPVIDEVYNECYPSVRLYEN